MHDQDDVLSVLRKVATFFSDVSKGQGFSVWFLRHVPGSSEKLVQKFEEFMLECIHEYKAMGQRYQDTKFEQRQQFLLVRRELDLYLTRLFWGSFNNNRDLLTGDQWIRLNQIAIELTYILDLLKGEFYYGQENSCA